MLLTVACDLGGCAGGGAACALFAMAGGSPPSLSNRSMVRRRKLFDRRWTCWTANPGFAPSRLFPRRLRPPPVRSYLAAQVFTPSRGRTVIAPLVLGRL